MCGPLLFLLLLLLVRNYFRFLFFAFNARVVVYTHHRAPLPVAVHIGEMASLSSTLYIAFIAWHTVVGLGIDDDYDDHWQCVRARNNKKRKNRIHRCTAELINRNQVPPSSSFSSKHSHKEVVISVGGWR